MGSPSKARVFSSVRGQGEEIRRSGNGERRKWDENGGLAPK